MTKKNLFSESKFYELSPTTAKVKKEVSRGTREYHVVFAYSADEIECYVRTHKN